MNEIPEKELELDLDRYHIDSSYQDWKKGDVLYWVRGDKLELFGRLLEDAEWFSSASMGGYHGKVERWSFQRIGFEGIEVYDEPQRYTEKPILNRTGLVRVMVIDECKGRGCRTYRRLRENE